MPPFRSYFHVTPATNRPSVAGGGILPIFSRGKLPVVWLVTKTRVLWALAHVSSRHQVPVSALDVVELRMSSRTLTRRRYGVWTSENAILPYRFVRWINPEVFIDARLPDQADNPETAAAGL